MKALVIVDMANDFVDPKGSLYVPGSERLVPEIASLVRDFRRNGDLVVGVNDCHDYFDHDVRSGIWPKHCMRDTWGQQEPPQLQKLKYPILPKKHYDGFKGTGLSLQIAMAETVYLAGVCTEICVFATAMGAYDLKFKTAVYANTCMGLDVEEHRQAICRMNRQFNTQVIW